MRSMAGTPFADDQEAWRYACRVISELHQDGGYDAAMMTVADDAGRLVFAIPFSAVASGSTRKH